MQLLQLVHGGEHPSCACPAPSTPSSACACAGCSTPTTPTCSRRRTGSASVPATPGTCRPRKPSDALPGDRAELERLALLLGYVHRPHSTLRDDYRRVTRRARSASSNASSTTPDDQSPTRKRWAVPGAIALALVPFVVVGDRLARRASVTTTCPSADQAWIELQIRDIGHDPVLLGPYSRFGWFHPGPILYYLLWLPYRITGSTARQLRRRRAHAQRGRARRHRARGQAARRAPAPAADASS